jgi:hypothetical protein
MWLLLIPLLLVGLVLVSIAALAAGLLHLLGPAWPLLLIALGVWMLRRGDRHHERRSRKAWKHQQRRDWSTPNAPRGERSEPAPGNTARTELPVDVQVKVEQIRRKVEVLLGYADRFPPFSHDLYLVRQTASDYLPRTIDAYLGLPKETAERPAALQELRQQLDLLDAKLDEIAQDLQRQDVDRLLANRRFLEDRFGRASA